jgi:SPP1 family predicted phage head-tail adaptor
MSIEAGRLRHRIVLQSPSYAQDPTTGEMVPSWVSEGEAWAAVEPLSAKEFIAAQSTQAQIDTRIVIRYRSDVAANWRATHRGKIFNIHGVLADKDSGLEYLTLPCSSGVNNGE